MSDHLGERITPRLSKLYGRLHNPTVRHELTPSWAHICRTYDNKEAVLYAFYGNRRCLAVYSP